MFWVLILSIVCLCQGFQLCIVCKIGKILLRKGKQVLIMKTCCGFNIYHIVHTSLRCKQYHVTMKYENIILQHLNIYSVNVDNLFGVTWRFALRSLYHQSSNDSADRYVSVCSIFPKCTNQTRQIGINIHRLTVVQYVLFFICFVEHYMCVYKLHMIKVCDQEISVHTFTFPRSRLTNGSRTAQKSPSHHTLT